MNVGELKEFFFKQDKAFNETELKFVEENFFTYAARENEQYLPLKFYNQEHITRLIATIEHLNPDIILVDSATKAIAQDMNVQSEVTKSMEMIYRIRNELDTAMIVIHHPRKSIPSHGFKEADIDDMFGAQALQQDASAIIAVSREKNEETGALSDIANLTYLKTRFTGDNARTSAKLDKETLMFRRYTAGELVAKAEVPKQRSAPKTKETKSGFDF
jgi:RecA-family ATPase